MKIKSLLIGAALLSMCSGAWAAAAPAADESQVILHVQTNGLPSNALITSSLEAESNWDARIGQKELKVLKAEKDEKCVNLTVSGDSSLFGRPDSNSSTLVNLSYTSGSTVYAKPFYASIASELAAANSGGEPHAVTANSTQDVQWVQSKE